MAPTLLAKVEQATYKQELACVQRDSIQRRIDWFDTGKCPFISKCFSKRRQMFLAEKVKTQLYAPDEVIYKEGDKVDTMFLIRYGKCIARKNLMVKQEGVEFPYGITLAEFNVGEYFGEEIAVGTEQRLLRVVAGGGGAEVIVILQTVAQEIFTPKAWESIREQHKALLPQIQEHYDQSVTKIRCTRLNYDVKTRALDQKYQHRAKYTCEYADTVDVLIDIEKSREDYLREQYHRRMGQTLQNVDTHVVDIKRYEEDAWRAARAEKLRQAARLAAMGGVYVTEEEEAVMLERARPSTSEVKAAADDLRTQLSYVENDVKAREIRAANSQKVMAIPQKLQELQRKIAQGSDNE